MLISVTDRHMASPGGQCSLNEDGIHELEINNEDCLYWLLRWSYPGLHHAQYHEN